MIKQSKANYLYGALKIRVLSMREGERFPSVRKLMDEYGASQFSIAPALKMLQEQGYLAAEIGKGSVVRKPEANRASKVLLLSPRWSSPTVDQMRKAICDEAHKAGFRCEVREYDEFDAAAFSSLSKGEADGILFDPLSNDNLTAEQMNALATSPTPVVLCCSSMNIKNISYANGNNALAGVLIADELADKGHKELVLLISEPQETGNARAMINGFLCQAKRRGCRVVSLDCGVRPGENSIEKSEAFLKKTLDSGPPPGSAMFVLSRETAIVAAKLLKSKGVRIPEDLSLISFGSAKFGHDDGAEVDAVGHPMEKIAEAAVKILAAQLRGDTRVQSQIEIEPELFESGTVKRLNASGGLIERKSRK